MKRVICALTVLTIVLLAFAGCTQNNDGSQHNDSETPATISDNSTTEQDGKNDIHLLGSSTSDGYYYTDIIYPYSANLLYIDFNTRQEIALCSKPECIHDNESCTSYIQLNENMAVPEVFVVNDQIIYFSGALFVEEVEVVAVDLDGSGKRTLCSFPNNLLVISTTLFSDGTCMYFYAYEYVENKQGEIEELMTLVELNITDGALTFLKQYPANESAQLLYSAVGRDLILSSWYVDYSDALFEQFYTYNVDTGKTKEMALLDGDNTASFAQDGYFYELPHASHKVTRTNLETGEKQTIDFSELYENEISPNSRPGINVSFGDILRLEINEFDTDIRHQYLIDFTTNEYHPFDLLDGFRGQAVYIVSEQDDFLLVLRDYTEVTTFDAVGDAYTTYIPVFAIISKEDYANSNPNYIDIPSFRSELAIYQYE